MQGRLSALGEALAGAFASVMDDHVWLLVAVSSWHELCKVDVLLTCPGAKYTPDKTRGLWEAMEYGVKLGGHHMKNIFSTINNTFRLLAVLFSVQGAAEAMELQGDAIATPYVLSGWGEAVTANQLVALWMADREKVAELTPLRLISDLPAARGALRRIKNGVGLDYRMAAGGLHLNLYSRRKPKGEGVRGTINPASVAAEVQRWTLGASLQQVRTASGDRFVSLVPQLVVNPDGAHAGVKRWRFSMEYGYWFGGSKRAAKAERVLQASISARF